MKKILLAAAVLALATPAHAYTPTVCHFGLGYAVCEQLVVNPDAKIIHVDPPIDPDADGAMESRAHWYDRCNPVLSHRNPYTGMQHWTFAQRGCEYGPE